MRISFRLLVCIALVPIAALALLAVTASYLLLPPDTDRHFQIHVRRGSISVEASPPSHAAAGGQGEAREKTGSVVKPHEGGGDAKEGHAMAARGRAVGGGGGGGDGWVNELDLAYAGGREELRASQECREMVDAEMKWENPRQQRFALVKKEGRWPPAGPDFGGSTVLFYPQTGAAKREGVMCQFGASVLSGGYDAFNGVVACSPPPWVHIVQEGETLSSIAQRYGMAASALSSTMGDGINIGQVLMLQDATISVSLSDSSGKTLPGERNDLSYSYHTLSVSSVWPTLVPNAGGVLITVEGHGFSRGGGKACHIRCRFGGIVQSPGIVLSDRLVVCAAPPLPTDELEEGEAGSVGTLTRSVKASVALNGVDFTPGGLAMLSYYRHVLCISASDVARGAPLLDGGAGLSIFAVPKAFTGEARERQMSAVRSWTALNPRPKIFLVGDEEGVSQAAADLGVHHLAGVIVNDRGTPLLNSTFDMVRKATADEVLLFVNADILLFHDVLLVASRAWEEFGHFLVIGRRTNCGEGVTSAAATATGTEAWHRVRKMVQTEGKEHIRWAIDYFVFSRGLFENVPPFAVGRPAYDNWLVRHAIASDVPVIDASSMVAAGHQAHTYGHVVGAKEEAAVEVGKDDEWSKAVRSGKKRERDVWEKLQSGEIEENFQLARGEQVKLGTTDHATWVTQACPG